VSEGSTTSASSKDVKGAFPIIVGSSMNQISWIAKENTCMQYTAKNLKKRQYEITATASSKQSRTNPSDGNPSPRANTQKHYPPKSTSLSSSQAQAFIAKHHSQKETITRSEGPISEILLECCTHNLIICKSPYRVVGQLTPESSRLALPRHALPLAKGLALLLFLFLDLDA
jgi:hypothetical protein